MLLKRVFDIVFSILAIVLLTPLLLFICILVKLDSQGPILYKQLRVGQYNKDFEIWKFRTMYSNSDSNKTLTIGNNDSRITKLGYYLRKYKLDELPQLFNIVKGDMSFVGPRPELRKYVNYYSASDLVVLQVKPGLTGLASLKYKNEPELLKASENPEHYYIKTILSDKLNYNKQYVKTRSFLLDLKIISSTIFSVFFK
ncbi:sugar transferase [Aestuariibaculum sediminum]|uniref:Sugar transferase n=1 Tax=Aestuariibaculum sediminum TaxID=2770637 RepID=A0A8J6QHG2_9FLAO|nr:sugar transferase [Aestuariibaculum sediminum]MBD0831939.1 sugar transferase [Aestuariibaculum sediminum]